MRDEDGGKPHNKDSDVQGRHCFTAWDWVAHNCANMCSDTQDKANGRKHHEWQQNYAEGFIHNGVS